MRFVMIMYVCMSLFTFVDADDLDPFDTKLSLSKSAMDFTCKAPNLDKSLGLEDVVRIALCNNPQTKIAWQTSLYQASMLGASQSSYLPTVSANGSALDNGGTSSASTGNQQNVNVSLSYLLYDFGKREANVENAKQLLFAASTSENTAVQKVFLSAFQAYYLLFGSNASLEAFREAERAALESLNAANVRYTVGTATPADKLQAQTAYSQAVLNRIRAEGSVKSAQGDLGNALGMAPDVSLNLISPSLQAPPEMFEKNIHALMEEAKKIRPDLLSAQSKIKAYESSVKAARADNMPSFSLSSNLGHTDTTSNSFRSSSVGLYVSIPIFNGFNTTYKIQAAREQLKISEAEYEKLSQDASLEVYKAYQSLVSETQAVRTSFDLVASAKASEELALGRYKAGVGNILDLLSAQSALASAKQQQIQALYNWYITKATLAKAMGILDFSTIKGQL